MAPFLSLHISTPCILLSPSLPFFHSLPLFKSPSHRTYRFPVQSLSSNPFPQSINRNSPIQPPRTLFPGGYKRPEIKVPNIVLQLDPDEVLSGADALNFIDEAISKWVGIVVLNGGDGTGKTLYDAASLLKSLVKDRAHFLIGERVDIAAAVNATGVVLSDQGLPSIVARNMMMGSKSESVLLPLVARNVNTLTAALNASNSEGADFLIYGLEPGKDFDLKMDSGSADIKVPIFVIYDSRRASTSVVEASKLLKSGAGGLAMSLDNLRLFNEESLNQLFDTTSASQRTSGEELKALKALNINHDIQGRTKVAGFVKLNDRENQLIETERSLLLEAIDVIKKAAPQMEEISLLIDAVSQIDEPFLLAIVGEFNSGKSSVINALLGERYLKEGVIPTTNEITFLCYSEYNSKEPQRCERHPDGQYICYLPAPILKQMKVVDTPGTNVILQRQQRLTEEFVPRADLLLFVISADRPLTESEVDFLCYIQQWKKKVVFVLNKSDLYQNTNELEEAISFIKENVRKLLNTENVILYPVSARSALEAKLLAAENHLDKKLADSEYHWKTNSFFELEKFLYSFLDGSTETGIERMKLKLETPITIANRIFSSCDSLVKEEVANAKQDLALVTEIVDSVKEYRGKMEKESISWRAKTLSLIESTKSRVLELIESTLQITNLDIAASYMLRGEKSAKTPAVFRVQHDIIGPAVSDAQKLLEEYASLLKSSSTCEGKLYEEAFEKRWPLIINPNTNIHIETSGSLDKVDALSLKVMENFSTVAASQLFEQEIREVYLGTFGGLGAAGLSASLLTSVLPTTLEDLLALALCSTGGFIAISKFPSRKRGMMDKVGRIADGLSREVEEAMQKDLVETVVNLEKLVKSMSKPYEDAAQERVDKLLDIQKELSDIQKQVTKLQIEIQNLHVS
ncbi:probable transmembrane GTPase FZO-like, chloroplastic [Euphorbia lathyris]|uniref:probable transmembrane GTPase FZO-like, chloroplastic n=1 Tax=Euphorbia lathyris TaxID=212925 RepID=UPI003314467B